uniref:Adaptor complexes medium subunit family protein n=1 Tax=Neospora caninum (strain Liverpool) TaxID=572307 RepID=A0A0F7UGX4_NEOCL|nr:TPA: hypothetical protein BN1204_048385 [Neospora caninum Liverpool]
MCSLRGWWLLEVPPDAASPFFSASREEKVFEDEDRWGGRDEPGDGALGTLSERRVSSLAAGRVRGSGESETVTGSARSARGTGNSREDDQERDRSAVRVLLSRRYVTVDERWRKLAGPAYVPLPSDEELRHAFLTQLLHEPQNDAWRCCTCCSTASEGEPPSSHFPSSPTLSNAAHTFPGRPETPAFPVDGDSRTVGACALHPEEGSGDGVFESSPSFYYDLYQERHFEELTWPCGPTAMLVLPAKSSSACPFLDGGRAPSHRLSSKTSFRFPSRPDAPCRLRQSHEFSGAERGEGGLYGAPPAVDRRDGPLRKCPFSSLGDAPRGVCSLAYPSPHCRDLALSSCPSPGSCPAPPPPKADPCLPVNSAFFSILWPVVFVRKEIPAFTTETDASSLSGSGKQGGAEIAAAFAAHAGRHTSAFTGGTPVPAALLRPTSGRGPELTTPGSSGKARKAEDPEDTSSAGFMGGTRKGLGGRVIVALAALAIDDALSVDSLHPATASSFDLPQVTAAFHVLDHLTDLYLSLSLAFPPSTLVSDPATVTSPTASVSSRRPAASPAPSSLLPYAGATMSAALPHSAPGVSARRPRPQSPFGSPARGDSSSEGASGVQSRPTALPFLMAVLLALPFGRPKLTSPSLLQNAYESVASLPVSYSFLPPQTGRETKRRGTGARGRSRESLEGGAAEPGSRSASEEAPASGRRRHRSASKRRKVDGHEEDRAYLVPPRPPGPNGPSQSLAQLREAKVKQYLESLSPAFSTVDLSQLPAVSADLRELQLRHWRRQLEEKRASLSSSDSPGSGPFSDFVEAALGSSVYLDFEDQDGAAFSDVSFSDLCPPVAAPHCRTLHRRFFEHALWRRRSSSTSAPLPWGSPWAGSDPVGAQLASVSSATACTSAFTPSAAGSIWSVPAWLPQLSPSGWAHGVPGDSREGEEGGENLKDVSKAGTAAASTSSSKASRWWMLGTKKKHRSQTPEYVGAGASRRGGNAHQSLSTDGRSRREKGRQSWWKKSRDASVARGEAGRHARGSSWDEERCGGSEWHDSGAATDVEGRFDAGRRVGRSRERHRLYREGSAGSLVLLNEALGERALPRVRGTRDLPSSPSPQKGVPGFSIFSAFGRAAGLMSAANPDSQGCSSRWKWLTRSSWIRFSIVENIHCTMHEPRPGVQGPEARASDECFIVGDLYVTVCLRKMMEVSAPLAFSRTESLPDVYVHPTARLSNSAVDLLSCASSKSVPSRGSGQAEKSAGKSNAPPFSAGSIEGREAHSVHEGRGALPPLVISCVPPLGVQSYLLCKYRFGSLPFYPMKALYQVKEVRPGVLRLLLQVQIHPGVVGRLHACSLWIPFGHKGTIESHDLKASQGTFRIVSDQRAVLWTLPKHLKRTPVAAAHASTKDSTDTSSGGKEEAKASPTSGRPHVSLLGELVLAPLSSSADSEGHDDFTLSRAPSNPDRFPMSPRRRRARRFLPSDRQQSPGESLQPGPCGDGSGPSGLGIQTAGRAAKETDPAALLAASRASAVAASGASTRPRLLPVPDQSPQARAARYRQNLIAAAGAEESLPLAVRRFLADEVERAEAVARRFAGDEGQLVGPGAVRDAGSGAGRARDGKNGMYGLPGSEEERVPEHNLSLGSQREENLRAAHEASLRTGQPHGVGGGRAGSEEATPSPFPDRVEGGGSSAQLRIRADGGGCRAGARADEDGAHTRGLAPSAFDSRGPYRPQMKSPGPTGLPAGDGAARASAGARRGSEFGQGTYSGASRPGGSRDREAPPRSAVGGGGRGRQHAPPQTGGAASGVYTSPRAVRSGGGLLTDREELILKEGVNNFLALIHFEAKDMTLSGSSIDKEAVTLYPYEHLELAPAHGSSEDAGTRASSVRRGGASGAGTARGGSRGRRGDREKLQTPGWGVGSSGGNGDDAGCSISVFKRTVAGRYVVWNALGDNKASRVNLSFDEGGAEEAEANAYGSDFPSHPARPPNVPGGYSFAARAVPAFPSTATARQFASPAQDGSAGRGETEGGTTASSSVVFPDAARVRVDRSLSPGEPPARILGAAAAERGFAVETDSPSPQSRAGLGGFSAPSPSHVGDKIETNAEF